MNYFIFLESFGSSNVTDDIGIVLIFAAPVLLLIAFVLLIVSIAKKNNKAKMGKMALMAFIASGVSALVGLGTCGWF